MAATDLVDAPGSIDEPPAAVDVDPVRRSARAEVVERLAPGIPGSRLWGWVFPLLVTVFGGALRFWNLGQPNAVVFDETYYMKGGLSLLVNGTEQRAVDGADGKILGGVLDVFQSAPDFVVHPPLGKWTIALGEYLFGVNPWGWRSAVAALGTLAILITARTARRMTRSTLIGTTAGLLLAVDGMAIVHSRTALLDQSIMLFALCAFALLVIDRDRARVGLARRVEAAGVGPEGVGQGLGPWLLWRPWRYLAAVFLGLTVGVKWSGLWFLAFFGLMTVVWDVGARRLIGVRRPWLATLLRDAIPAFLIVVGIAVVTYLVTWTGWFVTDGGWARDWAAKNPGQGVLWLPEAVRSLWHYHQEAWGFHVNLTSPHSYQSNPWSWPVMGRPTSFFYESYPNGVNGCTADQCASEVIALGNPVVWWGATIAMFHQAWRWLARRDWRSGAVWVGVLAGWFPWLLFQGRTIFTFYAIAFTPFLVIALAMSLGTVLGPSDATPNRRMWGAMVSGGVVLAAVAAGWWFYPIWVGDVIPYNLWRLRMWFPSWV